MTHRTFGLLTLAAVLGACSSSYKLSLCGTDINNNSANEGGGAISNNGTGALSIKDSTLRANPSGGFETDGYPGIFVQGAGTPSVTGSTLE